jgi:hypothetical protein
VLFRSNALGNGPWSSTRIFTTKAAPILPGRVTLNAPANQSTAVSTIPTFNWNTDPFSTTYEVRVARDPGFTVGLLTGTSASNQITLSGTLDAGALYFWSVRGVNDNGVGQWSFIYVFTTAGGDPQSGQLAGAPVFGRFTDANSLASEGIPSLIAPGNGDINVTNLPLLVWSEVVGAASYTYQVSADVSFETGVFSGSATEAQFQIVTALEYATPYFWRVRSVVEDTPGDWSLIGLFTTGADPNPDPVAPARVRLDGPANQATDVSVAIALSWNTADHADTYEVQVYADAQLSNLVASTTTGTTTFTPGTPFAYSQSYYWRVRGVNNVGNGDWSSLRLFTTESDPNALPVPPSTIVLKTPFTGSDNVARSGATMTWETDANASGYELQLSNSPTFDTFIVQATVSGGSHTLGTLTYSTLHYWRVRGTSDAGNGEWSDTWLFTTEADPVPVAVTLSSPSNGVELVQTSPFLRWLATPQATSYEIQIATNATFDSNLLTLTSSDVEIVPATQLSFQTLYYWRVRALNESIAGDWSQVWIFETEPDPAPPVVIPGRVVLIEPATQATGIALTPNLSWQAISGADSYTVAVSTSPTFENNVLVQSGLTQTQFAVTTPLSYQTTYYWRVRATNSAGDGQWSLIFVFTTLPDPTPPPSPLLAVDLVSPEIGAVDVSVSPTMVWRTQAQATGYRLQVSSDATFAANVIEQSVSDTTFSSTGLAYETIYYWRVRVVRGQDDGPWSATRIFTTEVDPTVPLPARVTLSSPANLADGVSITPSLFWRTAANAATYELQFGLTPTFEQTLLSVSVSDTTRAVGLTLAYETVHFWRVRAVNETGNGEWSVAWSFTTELDPTPPLLPPGRLTLTAPSDAAVNVAVRPTFTWQADDVAETYELQYSDSPLFAANVQTITGATTTATPAQSLAYNTTYYWRVRASNEAGVGPWSSIRSFTTIPLIRSFALLSPANNGNLMLEGNENNEVEITWQAAETETSAAVTYRFYVLNAQNDVLGDAVLQVASDENGSATQVTFTMGQLSQVLGLSSGQNRDIFWTVVAESGTQSREAAQRFALRVSQTTLTDIPFGEGIPSEFILSQNYPNPFNPGTRISYAVPGEQHVYLGVYDLLGRRVAVLVNQVQPDGSYNVNWNASGLSSGIYLYRLEAGSFTQTRRMMLMK